MSDQAFSTPGFQEIALILEDFKAPFLSQLGERHFKGGSHHGSVQQLGQAVLSPGQVQVEGILPGIQQASSS